MVNINTTSLKTKETNGYHQAISHFEFTKSCTKAECSPDPGLTISEFMKMLKVDGDLPDSMLYKVEEMCHNKARLSSEVIESVLSTLFEGGECIFSSCSGKFTKEGKPGRKPINAIAVPSFKCNCCRNFPCFRNETR